jgi:hypothetical protein
MSGMPEFAKWANQQTELARRERRSDMGTVAGMIITFGTLAIIHIIRRRAGVDISSSVALPVVLAVWWGSWARWMHRAPGVRVLKAAVAGAVGGFLMAAVLRILY